MTLYEQPGGHRVETVRYVEPNPAASIKSGRVYINDTQFFEGVPKNVWEFQVGGYQVCEKWLKDRKGRALTSDDIDHYQKIVVALERNHPPHARNRRPHPLLAAPLSLSLVILRRPPALWRTTKNLTVSRLP